MNEAFDNTNKEYRNLSAKIRNAISDLNFHAYLILTRRLGFESTPQTGVSDAIKYKKLHDCEQLNAIIERVALLKECTPENANTLFYQTFIFIHELN